MPFDKQYSYLPPIPSPLNPEAYYDFPSRPALSNKQQQVQQPSSHRPRPRRTASSPTLSYAQHILRAKAAEVWRTEQLRRIAREAHSPPKSNSSSLGGERDITDCPLTRAALDMYQPANSTVTNSNNNPAMQPSGAVVDLEHSLGLDPISYGYAEAMVVEKPRFGLLQPFTVDLSAVTPSPEYQPQGAHEQGGSRTEYKRVVARRVLLLILLLCLSYCLLPGMRYRASLRQQQQQRQGAVMMPVTS